MSYYSTYIILDEYNWAYKDKSKSDLINKLVTKNIFSEVKDIYDNMLLIEGNYLTIETVKRIFIEFGYTFDACFKMIENCNNLEVLYWNKITAI